MSMTQDEYERQMKAIAERHTNEVVYLVNINVLAAQLCVRFGHDFHLMMAECVRCYCVEHEITIEQMRACATDLDRLSATIDLMAKMREPTGVSPQVSNFCSQLANKAR